MTACARKGGVIGLSGSERSWVPERRATWYRVCYGSCATRIALVGPEHVGLGLDFVFDRAELEEYVRLNPADFRWPRRHGDGRSGSHGGDRRGPRAREPHRCTDSRSPWRELAKDREPRSGRESIGATAPGCRRHRRGVHPSASGSVRASIPSWASSSRARSASGGNSACEGVPHARQDLPPLRILAAAALLTLSGCGSRWVARHRPGPLRPVERVDLQRYMSGWFVIANIPYFAEKGCFDSVEGYALLPDGRIDNRFACREKSFDAPMKPKLRTIATVRNQTSNAEWRVPFYGVLRVKYFIIDLDPGLQVGRDQASEAGVTAGSSPARVRFRTTHTSAFSGACASKATTRRNS